MLRRMKWWNSSGSSRRGAGYWRLARRALFSTLAWVTSGCEADDLDCSTCTEVVAVTIETESGRWKPGRYEFELSAGNRNSVCLVRFPDDLPTSSRQGVECTGNLRLAMYAEEGDCHDCAREHLRFDTELIGAKHDAFSVRIELDESEILNETQTFEYAYEVMKHCDACNYASVAFVASAADDPP